MSKDVYTIYTTDEHLTERSFKCRTDNFLETMLGKLQRIGVYLQEHREVKYWLSGGDFFHTNSQNCRMINQIIRVFKEFPRQDIFPIIILAGNHIEKKNAEQNIKDSGLHTLQEAGYFQIVGDPWIRQLEDRKVMMWHSDVVPAQVPWPHTTYQEISEQTDADYFLVSHYHTPNDIVEINNTTFVVPGSLSRGTGSEKTHKRVPQFAKFSLTGEKQCEYVPVWAEESYPFVEKAISVDIKHKSEALVSDIESLWEGFERDSVDFAHVVEHFKAKNQFTPAMFLYAKKVYEDIS